MNFKIIFLVFLFSQLSTLSQEMSNSDNLFDSFLKKVQQAGEFDKQSIADEFIRHLNGNNYPIFLNDSTVVLIYKGNADSVKLLGDMTNWSSSIPFQKIEGTDLFYFRGIYEPEARFEYLLELKKDEFPLTDQFNQFKAVNALWEMSVLAMPRYVRHTFFTDYEKGRKGDSSKLKAHQVPSKYLGYDHLIHIYLPPDYDIKKSYPSIYFQDGMDYVEYGLAPHILNELISSGQIEPVIGVFVTPPNLHQPKMPNRMTEYGMNDDYVNFFTKELVPFIDSIYSTKQQAAQRLVVGDSYGGLISAYISFTSPDVFGNAYSQSGYLSFNKDKLIKMFDSFPVRSIKLFIDVGTYEETVGTSFIPPDEVNFTEGNRRFKDVLQDKGYDFLYKEYYEGHTWGNWRRHLIDAFLHFFGTNITIQEG